MTDFDHEKLDVYVAAIDFVALADEIVEHLPRGRAYLADQPTPRRVGHGLGHEMRGFLRDKPALPVDPGVAAGPPPRATRGHKARPRNCASGKPEPLGISRVHAVHVMLT
jgi:hypothetical protein